MALFGAILRGGSIAARTLFKGARAGTGAALSVPGVRGALKATGIGATVLGIGQALIPQGGGGGMPMLPGAAGLPMAPGMGERSIFRDDPNVVEALKPFAISTRNLKQFFRAPKGFVIMRDAVGDAYGIPKKIAQQYLGWKPAKKPLLSIRDTSALRRAGTAIKKLQNAEKMARKIANWHAPRRSAPRPTIIELPGPKAIGRKVG